MGIAGRFGTLADICDCSAFSQAVHQPHERRRRGSHDHVQDLPPGSKNVCIKGKGPEGQHKNSDLTEHLTEGGLCIKKSCASRAAMRTSRARQKERKLLIGKAQQQLGTRLGTSMLEEQRSFEITAWMALTGWMAASYVKSERGNKGMCR
eukprot:scaffold6414_cov19-Tisochrysis_lutea.AAC.1